MSNLKGEIQGNAITSENLLSRNLLGQMEAMKWDLGDDVNFMLVCKEQELDENIALGKAEDVNWIKVGKFSVKKAESMDDEGLRRMNMEDVNDSQKLKAKNLRSCYSTSD